MRDQVDTLHLVSNLIDKEDRALEGAAAMKSEKGASPNSGELHFTRKVQRRVMRESRAPLHLRSPPTQARSHTLDIAVHHVD